MLTITVEDRKCEELWDDENEEFIPVPAQKGCTLQLEHSLISLSRWESKWCKPFLLDKDDKTEEETLDYIRCMTLNKNVDPGVYDRLTSAHIEQIRNYIYAPMTATTINERKTNKKNRKKVTSELIYYWMIANNIPFECEKWHLNRLITLIKVCNAENEQPKKTSRGDLVKQYAAINAANRRRFNSKG